MGAAASSGGGIMSITVNNRTDCELHVHQGKNWHGKDNEANAPAALIAANTQTQWQHCNHKGRAVLPENLWVYALESPDYQDADKYLLIYSNLRGESGLTKRLGRIAELLTYKSGTGIARVRARKLNAGYRPPT